VTVPAPIEVIDSHTEGEPTRVVLSGWPIPGGASVAERLSHLRREHDLFRRAVVLEPRGHDAVVGALLVPPDRPEAITGVIFFNDVSWLGMCGHGLIGVVRTLEHLGRLGAGRVELDTPVGPVSAVLEPDGAVTIRNVASRVHRTDVSVEVPGVGRVTGDIAWGGNWFFLAHLDVPLEYARRHDLMRLTNAIRDALATQGITGDGGALIDHVELFGPPTRPDADSRNFVLCPGNAFDRSPCGTGTSAKMAVLHHRGALPTGQQWRQESIIGSRFVGWLEALDGVLLPHIRGNAYVTARSTLLFDPADPYIHGLG
jgi:proline racemase